MNHASTRLIYRLIALAVLALTTAPTPTQAADNLSRDVQQRTFDLVWSTINEHYFAADFGGHDWRAIGNEYRKNLDDTHTCHAFHTMLDDMVNELGHSHLMVQGPTVTQTQETGAPTNDPMLGLLCGQVESKRIHPDVGYVRFPLWSFDLAEKLETALTPLSDTRGLILDLRHNNGGVDPGATWFANFVSRQPGLLSIETSRQGQRLEWSYEGNGDQAYTGKLAILVDEKTASTSEIVAAALQESGRAIVLGSQTYGGVLNSTQVKLPTGGTLQYPHSTVTTPKGRTLEAAGVTPDIVIDPSEIDQSTDEYDPVIQRALDELTN